MSKRVQLLGHIAEIANAFVGLIREVTVDTDNAELRLHDGVTEGGRRFLDRDANDNRYQARSVELDGLLGWEPQERGFPVRLGPSNYRLRSITVDGRNLTVDRGNGYDGNPFLALNPAITTDHLWIGENVFEQPIEANGGVVGNVVGNTAGTHTGPVVGNVTGNLTGNADGDHTGTFVGDADFRGHGVAFEEEQILLPWLEPAIIAAWTSAGVPVGTIVAYGGLFSALPSNWKVCDGANGTPDLRERFIRGASADFPAGLVGGTPTHSHAISVGNGGSHSHTGTVGGTALTANQLPAHFHGNGVSDDNAGNIFPLGTQAISPTGGNIDTAGGSGTVQGRTTTVGNGDVHAHSLTVEVGGSHAHTASAGAASNLPPFYALVYIMKVL